QVSDDVVSSETAPHGQSEYDNSGESDDLPLVLVRIGRFSLRKSGSSRCGDLLIDLVERDRRVVHQV
ncbi:hypothetical protein PENTCL1PPCAC_5439, partial [Pristionchus entomophagus]